MEYLNSLLRIEEYKIPHVQGNTTEGYRFKNEVKTLIVPMMRGGEPMAFGISKALTTAAFAHAYKFADFELGSKSAGNLEGKETIILVDSVINSGKSIVEFLQPLRRKYKNTKVVVVAGVVQAGATVGAKLAKMLEADGNLTLVALKKSENKFTGKGGTDTGDRLFNTTYLD
jgi:uracil phosphoribosyltransferase